MEIRLASPVIQSDSIVDGEGIRSVIWTQGCPHNCKGCHNPETHSFTDGYVIDIDEIKMQIDNLEGQQGITFSGGDPMMQPEACLELAKYSKKLGYNIWCYTGFTYEELLKLGKKKKSIMEFLKYIDVLVDGKFVLEEKSFDCIFRGSKNQRLIDVKKSLDTDKVVLVTKFDNNIVNKKGRKDSYMFV
ncbi:MAG: anaerobic ribonucleoside-triphosphate reductase activating protein [Bacilli bacterium]|nr:anaerobic ribonucleoside-triphosphate reductase activating protein [Bacilli bacterium]